MKLNVNAPPVSIQGFFLAPAWSISVWPDSMVPNFSRLSAKSQQVMCVTIKTNLKLIMQFGSLKPLQDEVMISSDVIPDGSGSHPDRDQSTCLEVSHAVTQCC